MALAEVLAPPEPADQADAEAAADLILKLENLDARVLGNEWLAVAIDAKGVCLLLLDRPGSWTRFTIAQLDRAIAAIRHDPPWGLPLTGLILSLLTHRLALGRRIEGASA